MIGSLVGMSASTVLLAADPSAKPLPPREMKANGQALAQGHLNPSVDVRDYGAIGDGKSDDRPAIQRAVDACAESGGGKVVLHNGTFLSGTVVLKSHVELHLTSTAVLKGSPDLGQYVADDKTPYRITARSLIYARDCVHVAITGEGTIDGNGTAFGKKEDDERPALIRLRSCVNVRLESFLQQNSGGMALNLLQCRQVRIDGLQVSNTGRPNTDGFGIDGCQEVFVSNCNIRSSDDCIALRTTEPEMACRDVVITNCILSSGCAAFRVGPDAVADIERVTLSNCVIRDARLNGIKIEQAMGAVMRDMTFSNIVMENTVGPISLRLAGWKKGSGNLWAVFDDSNWEKGRLENILFNNIRAQAKGDGLKTGMIIAGTARTKPTNITFSNVDITFAGGGTAEDGARREVPDKERNYPDIHMFGTLPAYGLYVHHAAGITLHNVQFHLASQDLRPAIVCDDVQDLELAQFKAAGDEQGESLIRLQNTQRAWVTGSRPLQAIGTFLRVEGAKSRKVSLRNNELSLAKKEVEMGPEVTNE